VIVLAFFTGQAEAEVAKEEADRMEVAAENTIGVVIAQGEVQAAAGEAEGRARIMPFWKWIIMAFLKWIIMPFLKWINMRLLVELLVDTDDRMDEGKSGLKFNFHRPKSLPVLMSTVQNPSQISCPPCKMTTKSKLKPTKLKRRSVSLASLPTRTCTKQRQRQGRRRLRVRREDG